MRICPLVLVGIEGSVTKNLPPASESTDLLFFPVENSWYRKVHYLTSQGRRIFETLGCDSVF